MSGATQKRIRWLVRGEQGETFGPVGFDTLKAWARDGRLSPASAASADGAAWMPVSHLPGLEMDWVAESSPGLLYGPIHQQALAELQKDGTIAPTAARFVRSDGADPAADERARAEAAEQAQKQLSAQVAQLTEQLAERSARLQRAEQQAAEFSALKALAQQLIAAQEAVAQQVLGAIAKAQVQTAGVLAEGQGCVIERVERVEGVVGNIAGRVAEDVGRLGQVVREVTADLKAAAARPGPSVERVYVEAVEVIPPEPHQGPPAGAPRPAPAPEAKAPRGGLSMAGLEQQAQRELERLGAQGVNLFRRKK